MVKVVIELIVAILLLFGVMVLGYQSFGSKRHPGYYYDLSNHRNIHRVLDALNRKNKKK